MAANWWVICKGNAGIFAVILCSWWGCSEVEVSTPHRISYSVEMQAPLPLDTALPFSVTYFDGKGLEERHDITRFTFSYLDENAGTAFISVTAMDSVERRLFISDNGRLVSEISGIDPELSWSYAGTISQ